MEKEEILPLPALGGQSEVTCILLTCSEPQDLAVHLSGSLGQILAELVSMGEKVHFTLSDSGPAAALAWPSPQCRLEQPGSLRPPGGTGNENLRCVHCGPARVAWRDPRFHISWLLCTQFLNPYCAGTFDFVLDFPGHFKNCL